MRANMSQKELATALFVTQQAVGRWEVNSSSPNPETVVKIAEILGITSSELLGDNLPPPSTGGTWVPVLGDVSARIPIETMTHILDYEEIDQQTASSGEFFALRINDNSMEPKISEGDVVIVRKQDTVDTGDIAIVLVNGDSATCKKIKKDPDGSLWLIPNNPMYEVKHFSPTKITQLPVSIIGKVVELRAKF